jgi:hypothetical protein
VEVQAAAVLAVQIKAQEQQALQILAEAAEVLLVIHHSY